MLHPSTASSGLNKQESYLLLRVHRVESADASGLPSFPTASTPDLAELPLGPVRKVARVRMGLGCDPAEIPDGGIGVSGSSSEDEALHGVDST